MLICLAICIADPISRPMRWFYQGYIWKKSPTGIRGFRKWQKRWFVISDKAITYFKKENDKEALGA